MSEIETEHGEFEKEDFRQSSMANCLCANKFSNRHFHLTAKFSFMKIV